MENSIYQFKVKDIDGNEISLEDYRGKVLLIVNVASKCGHTKRNYQQLKELHDKYSEKNFSILAFPCNQFGGQEPGDEEAIKAFATEKYEAEFKLFSKIKVKGKDAEPLYKFLVENTDGKNVKWNFEKFLIDDEGRIYKRYLSKVTPLEIEEDIKKLLP